MSTVRWNLKEAGGKIPTQGTRTSLGIGYGMSLLNKTKSNLLHRRTSVDDVGTWNESESSYRGRSHGREEITLNHG